MMNQEYYKSNLDKETLNRHRKEFRTWIDAINYGITMVSKGSWDHKKRKEYMIEVAKKVRLPINHIKEMELELKKS